MRKFIPLVAAASFTMIAGPVQQANASPFICMQTYEADVAKCDGDSACETFANIKFTSCMQALAEVKS